MPDLNHYSLQIETPKLLSIYLAPFFSCTNKTPHQIKTPKLVAARFQIVNIYTPKFESGYKLRYTQ